MQQVAQSLVSLSVDWLLSSMLGWHYQYGLLGAQSLLISGGGQKEIVEEVKPQLDFLMHHVGLLLSGSPLYIPSTRAFLYHH